MTDKNLHHALTGRSPVPGDPDFQVKVTGDPDYNGIIAAREAALAAEAGWIDAEPTGTIKIRLRDGIMEVVNGERLMGMVDVSTGNTHNMVGLNFRDGLRV